MESLFDLQIAKFQAHLSLTCKVREDLKSPGGGGEGAQDKSKYPINISLLRTQPTGSSVLDYLVTCVMKGAMYVLFALQYFIVMATTGITKVTFTESTCFRRNNSKTRYINFWITH
jgi:hypothetical protein